MTELLGTTLEDGALRQQFASTYAEQSGPIEDFWEGLRAEPEFTDKVDDLQFTLQAGALTGNHLPLVQKLQSLKEEGEIGVVRDLARYDAAGWHESDLRSGHRGTAGRAGRRRGRKNSELRQRHGRRGRGCILYGGRGEPSPGRGGGRLRFAPCVLEWWGASSHLLLGQHRHLRFRRHQAAELPRRESRGARRRPRGEQAPGDAAGHHDAAAL